MSEDAEEIHLRIEIEEEEPPRGRLVLIDDAGRELGEMRYRREGKDLVVIEHTEVDPSLRGKHGGRRFFEGMVAWARDTGTKIRSECPFTTRMFERERSSHDVLA
ncbi:MAG: GNAT family N-acetyltransferase [Polyangiales bacterium]